MKGNFADLINSKKNIFINACYCKNQYELVKPLISIFTSCLEYDKILNASLYSFFKYLF